MIRAFNITTDLVSSNQIIDYSFANNSFAPIKAVIRCISGLGPSSSRNTVLGGWYFHGAQLPDKANCGSGHIFETQGAYGKNFPGIINLRRCRGFNHAAEGVYSCIMMNSSMINQIMRVGIYFIERSKSLYMYSFTSMLTIFHLSAQLFQR